MDSKFINLYKISDDITKIQIESSEEIKKSKDTKIIDKYSSKLNNIIKKINNIIQDDNRNTSWDTNNNISKKDEYYDYAENNFTEENKNILKHIIPFIDLKNQVRYSYDELLIKLNYNNTDFKNSNDFYSLVMKGIGYKKILYNELNIDFKYSENDIYNRIIDNKIILWTKKEDKKQLMMSPNVASRSLMLAAGYNYLHEYKNILTADPYLILWNIEEKNRNNIVKE